MAIGLGTAVGYLNLDTTGFAKGIDSAISDMDKLEGSSKSISSSLTTVGDAFSKTGAALTAGITAPIIGFGAASVKAGMEFDSSMASVAAVSKATGEDFETIRDRAIEMGEKTRYSATEVSDAMYYMGLAGWDATQIYEGIPGVLALGAASGEDLARVSDIVTDSLTAFGKSAEDTTEFVNVLAEASRSSNTTVDMLGESFKYVGPVAGSFGYSLQDIATVLGIFANNGVKGSQAGTGLRQALNALINPSDKAAAQMDRYGVSLFNADGSTKSLMTVCEELRGTFGGLAVDIKNTDGEIMTGEEIMEKYGHSLPTNQMEKLTAIVQIFGVRALPGMLSVINAADEDFYGLAEAINGAQDAYDGLGTAFGMQETMLDNLQGDWYLFTSALGTTKILISDMANGALRNLLQKLTELVNKFNEMDPAQREQIVKWALIAASIGPVLLTIGKLITGTVNLINNLSQLKAALGVIGVAIKNFGEAFTLAKAGFTGFATQTNVLGAALGSLSLPILGVIAVIGTLVAAFATLWTTNEEFRNNMMEIWDGIVESFNRAGERIVEIFNELGFNFEDFKELVSAGVALLSNLWQGFCEILAPLFEGAFKFLAVAIKGVLNKIVGIFEVISGIIKGFKDGDWSMVWEGMADIANAKLQTIMNTLDVFGETSWNAINTIANLLGADWSMTWDEAKQAVSDWYDSVIEWITNIPQNIDNFVSQVGSAIDTFISDVLQWFAELPGKIAEFFANIWNSAVEWGANMITKAAEVGSGFLESVGQFFSQLPEKIAYFTGYALGIVIKWELDMVAKAREMGTNFLAAVVEFFVQLPGRVLQFVTSTLENVKKWVTDMVNKAREMGTQFLSNVVSFFQLLPLRVTAFLTSAWENTKKWASDMVNKARETGDNFVKNVVNFLMNLPSKVQTFFTSTISNASKFVSDMKTKATEAAKGFFDNIVSGLAGLPGKMVEIGSNIVQGIWNGISSGWQWLKDKVADLADSLLQGVKDALDIESPSKRFEKEVGYWIPPGIGVGYEKAMPALIKRMQRGLDNAVDQLSVKDVDIGVGAQENVYDSLGDTIDGFIDAYRYMFEGIVVWFETLEDRMAIAIENLVEQFEYLMYVRQTLGEDGFKNFILSGGNNIKSRTTTDSIVSDTQQGTSGDIFIFQSPKAINEVQAARLLRDTKRDLAEGF